MKRLGDRVQRRATEVQRKCAGAILQAVVLATPVGNRQIWVAPEKAPVGYVGGRARANWRVSYNNPRTDTTDAIDSRGESTIENGRGVISRTTPGSDIYLTNNLPYIIPLNDGHSKQAPAGFIQTSVAIGVDAIRGDRLTEDGR